MTPENVAYSKQAPKKWMATKPIPKAKAQKVKKK